MSTANMTADEHRTAAQEARQREADSWERSDTDGFMTQWANGLNAEKHDLAAQIAENGGMWDFPALFDLDGNLVPAKQVQTRYGTSWALLEYPDPIAPFTGWFNPSQANKGARRLANDRKKGYVLGTVRATAEAAHAGGNICCVSTIVRRTDGGFSAIAEVIETVSSDYEQDY